MLDYGLDLEGIVGFLIGLSMSAIGIAFLMGFTIKKLLQFIKSF